MINAPNVDTVSWELAEERYANKRLKEEVELRNEALLLAHKKLEETNELLDKAKRSLVVSLDDAGYTDKEAVEYFVEDYGMSPEEASRLIKWREHDGCSAQYQQGG